MACGKALGDDTNLARPMTIGLVTDIVGHGRFCSLCDYCQLYHQRYCSQCTSRPYPITYLKYLGGVYKC